MKKILLFLAIFGTYGCSVYKKPLYVPSNKNISYADNVSVKIIAERHGQILRNNLLNLIRDYPNNFENCIIEIKLNRIAEGVLFDNDGTANRLFISYEADIIVYEKATLKKIWSGNIKLPQSMNISKSAGEIMLSLYSEYEGYTIKRLARKIFDDLNMKLRKSNV